MADIPQPTSGADSGEGGFSFFLSGSTGRALQDAQKQTAGNLAAAIAIAVGSFSAQFLLFGILRWRLTRIYRPKTYMVAERQRVPMPPEGPWQWLKPIFSMPNSTVIHRCGLDAYFFLRYLRMLIKIFVPMAIVILPILLPINRYSGLPDDTILGVNVLGWQNVRPPNISRLWAHLVLAVAAIIWVLYIIYDELRGFIRIRQAYLTSPQHRIRASATTVLVSGIPRKWLSVEALNGLYDVFPGGIRNIWINRDFDELLEKVQLRDKYARQLEDAETVLIKKCVSKFKANEIKKAKEDGKKLDRKQRKALLKEQEQAAIATATGHGISSGDPHRTHNDLQSALQEMHDQQDHDVEDESAPATKNPIKLVTQGLGAVGHGIQTITLKSKDVVQDVVQDVSHGVKSADKTIDAANAGGGLVMEDAAFGNSSVGGPTSGTAQADDSIAKLVGKGGANEPAQTGSGLNDNQRSRRQSPPGHLDINFDARPAGPGRGVTHIGQTLGEDLQPTTDSREREERQGPLKVVANKFQAYRRSTPLPFPSPQPYSSEEEKDYQMVDLGQGPNRPPTSSEQRVASSKWAEAWHNTQFWKKSGEPDEPREYPKHLVEDAAEDQIGEPVWRQYIQAKDRETIRLPLIHQTWFPSLPLLGKKVDRIYHLRKELARLNAEIETDQDEVDRFPFMNSAFIQFNHQVAAHMACQSVSHHIPQHMTPRLVEISPSDVIWSNMSVKWWERYVRTALVVAASIGLIIFFAIPVTFTGLLSNIRTIAGPVPWLGWLARLDATTISIIQGILPPVLLAAILALVPIIFRLFVTQQGVPTGNDRELGVQQYYFAFLFIQVFLVVTISTSFIKLLPQLASNPTSVVQTLSQSLPSASNYFFSYMVVQALGSSAGAILQVGTLIGWFIFGPLFDSTARAKWSRQTTLPDVSWGSYFPPFTNFAVIGLIYSIISPLILVFSILTFSVFWFVQRYNIIYVISFVNDTGGLLFPRAINQLYTGIYVMELCLIGLFFIARDAASNPAGIPQGVIMIIMLVATVLFQILVNQAFAPLLRYLPITLEDDAVVRDEEFARAQDAKFRGLIHGDGHGRRSSSTKGGEDIEDRLEDQERRELAADREAEEADQVRAASRAHRSRSRSHGPRASGHFARTSATESAAAPHSSWKNKSMHTARGAVHMPGNTIRRIGAHRGEPTNGHHDDTARGREIPDSHTPISATKETANGFSVESNDAQKQREDDVEAQKKLAGDVLFSGFSDELEDLTPEERDTLVRYSFQHAALRARRPVVWIPRDNLGVSDDEIARCKAMSTVYDISEEEEGEDGEKRRGSNGDNGKTWIWMSNEGTALDGKNRVIFRRSPPDFASVDLIQL